ncbi:MAG TPA: GtrA family protein [Mycobacteriales bacterium]|jgi:putative flippase GtrA|nr:GtrA family protein [Mycobacteriales bacterium]
MTEDHVAPLASPVAELVAEAADRSAKRPTLFESLVRFCVTGVLSVATDFAFLFGLHSGANVSLPVATVVGSGAALVVNYSLNRNWSFQATASHGYTLVRYLFLAALNFGSTLLIVLGLTHLGLYYLISKLVAVAVNAGINFMTARFWVFKN